MFDNVDMAELVASIEANGLLNPIIVRNKADGRYEVISGHRRKWAYEILKINEIRAIVVNVNDNEAVIMMVDSNCQRSQILPSEKAFSYKKKAKGIWLILLTIQMFFHPSPKRLECERRLIKESLPTNLLQK